MNLFGWILFLDVAAGALYKVATVGRRRGPVTPSEAAWYVACAGAYCVGIATLGTLR